MILQPFIRQSEEKFFFVPKTPSRTGLAISIPKWNAFSFGYKTQKHNTFGYPKLLLQLEIEYLDGTKKIIVSDETWKLNVDGPIRTNNEYDGEEYDATKEFNGWSSANFNDGNWQTAEIVEAPLGKLTAQMSEPMKIMQTIKPITIKKLSAQKYIVDMGQNFSGWIKLKNVKGNQLGKKKMFGLGFG